MAPILSHDEYYENPYLVLILDHWKLIAAVTLVAIVVTYILTKFVMTPWYQATAIIEPIPQGAVENRVEGGLGAFQELGCPRCLWPLVWTPNPKST